MYKYCEIIRRRASVGGNNQVQQLYKAYRKLENESHKTLNKTICPNNLLIEDTCTIRSPSLSLLTIKEN